MINEFEKDYDDEVYEDNSDDEELTDDEDDDIFDDDEDDIYDWDDNGEKKVDVSFACEDCDYRWDDVIIKKKDNLDIEEEDLNRVCPMCGSTNITQI